MRLHCCGCQTEVRARLTSGEEIYPHRADLHSLPFWKCDTCKNYVGCHHKTKQRTKPLGVIPTQEIRQARIRVHARFDPIWKSGRKSRGDLYREISDVLGYTYHTADLRSVEDADRVLTYLSALEGK